MNTAKEYQHMLHNHVTNEKSQRNEVSHLRA